MMIDGKWMENITCPHCRARHPAAVTCERAAKLAQQAKDLRVAEQLHAEQMPEEDSELNQLHAEVARLTAEASKWQSLCQATQQLAEITQASAKKLRANNERLTAELAEAKQVAEVAESGRVYALELLEHRSATVAELAAAPNTEEGWAAALEAFTIKEQP